MVCAMRGIAPHVVSPPPVGRARSRLILVLGLGVLHASWGCVGVPPDSHRESALAAGWRALEEGRAESARQVFLEHTDGSASPRIRGEALVGLGKCELAAANPARDVRSGAHHLERAIPLVAGTGWTGTCEAALAEAYLELGSHELAREHLERAYPYLDGAEQRRAAGILSLLYEEDGYHGPTDEWRERAGDFVARPDYAKVEERYFPHTRKSRRPVPAPAPVPAKGIAHVQPKSAAVKATRVPEQVVSRKRWGARRLRADRVEEIGKVTRITVHHTADPTPAVIRDLRDASEYLQKMQSDAQNNKRWADIGYHYLIDSSGVVYEGRPLRYQGAHAGNSDLNQGNIGIALIGNFDLTRPSAAQLEALRKLATDLCKRYKIPHSRVEPHNAVRENGGEGSTACPGRHLHRMLPKLFAQAKSSRKSAPK